MSENVSFTSAKTVRLTIVTFLVAVAVPITIYLASQQQDTRKRASEGPLSFGIAPYVTINTPANGENIVGDVAITASIDNSKSVSGVEFYIDTKIQKVIKENPFTYVWQNASGVTPGTHTITVRAYDRDLNAASKTISVYKQ